MIKLETEFISGDGGFSSNPRTYKQVKRTDKAAMYERSVNGMVTDYEVFPITVKPKGTVIFSTTLEDDVESYPSTGQFGFKAWACSTRERAEKRYNQILEIEDTSVPEVPTKTISIPSVKVASKPLKINEDLIIPTGEFSIGELAEKNNVQYVTAFNFTKVKIERHDIKFVREERRASRGKATKIFTKS